MTEYENYYQWLLWVPAGKDGLLTEDIKKWDPVFRQLDDIPFRPYEEDDDNRVEDGISLRKRYFDEVLHDEEDPLVFQWGETSVFEVMCALAIKMEESIMCDDRYGDRTGMWFWNMIVSLGLGGKFIPFYDPEYVDTIIQRWMDHEYEPDGKGSLFTVRNRNDMRTKSVWQEMCAYLNTQR